MIRDPLAAGARYTAILITSCNGIVRQTRRDTSGAKELHALTPPLEREIGTWLS